MISKLPLLLLYYFTRRMRPPSPRYSSITRIQIVYRVNTEKTPAAETPCSFYFVYFPSPSLSRFALAYCFITSSRGPPLPRLSSTTPVARLSSMNCVTHIKFARVKKKRQREGSVCVCVSSFCEAKRFHRTGREQKPPTPLPHYLSLSLAGAHTLFDHRTLQRSRVRFFLDTATRGCTRRQ